MSELRDFLRFVRPHAPSCPDPVSEQYVRQAARTFCERTSCWRETSDIDISVEAFAPLALPSEAVLHKIEAAWFDDRPLTPITARQAADLGMVPRMRLFTGGTTDNAVPEGAPEYLVQESFDTIRVYPYSAGRLSVSMILKPSQDTNILPDFLFDHFAEIIAAGALAEMLELPGQTYTDPHKAARSRLLFREAIDRNANFNVKGQQRARIRTRPHYL